MKRPAHQICSRGLCSWM